jgi:eukaryotic-like serine/threonine-protein kinase
MNANDPKWTSFILRELEPEENEAIRQNIESNPDAIDRVEQIREISALIQESLNVHSPQELAAEERQAILAASHIRSGPRWFQNFQSKAACDLDLSLVYEALRAAVVHTQIRRIWAAAAACVVLFAAGLVVLRMRPDQNPEVTKPVGAQAPVTVMIADFSNHTGEAVFDNALVPVVQMALEETGFITAYDRTMVRNLGLTPIAGRLDEPAARQIAVGQGLGFVISGSLDYQETGYRLSIKATQVVTGDTIRIAEGTASGKDVVLWATTKVAAALRSALGDDASKSAQRFAMDTLATTSLEAVHEYATAREAMANRKFEDALESFSKATHIDSGFGVAYTGMAVAAEALGLQQEAEKNIKLALARLGRMTERERYRTQSLYYVLVGNHQKCAEEYNTLLGRFPSDATAHNNLALCLTQLRQMPEALQEARKAALILPKRTIYRTNVALYASYASDFASGEREARAVQVLDPSIHLGYISLAFAQLGLGELGQAEETYQKLEKISTLGSSYAVAGLADLALYEGRFEDAVRILEGGAAADLNAKYPVGAATKLATMAYTRLLQNRKGQAVAAAEKALDTYETPRTRFLAGRVFAATGQTTRAKALAGELVAEFQNEPQAYARLIEGEVALASGDVRAAIRAFSDANNRLDTWIGRFDLGRAYLEAGAFAEAESEFEQCIKRRGEALSLFFDGVPTYGYLPPVYYYQGRVREALNIAGFAESYRTYLSIRGKADEDPLLADVRQRIDIVFSVVR